MEFLSRVAELGMDITNDDEIVECYERLAEMYRSGGYSPNLEDSSPSNPLEDDEDDEDGSSARDARVATISPTGVADGPDVLFDGTSATTTANDNEEEMECA
jgi:hypothetical protein